MLATRRAPTLEIARPPRPSLAVQRAVFCVSGLIGSGALWSAPVVGARLTTMSGVLGITAVLLVLTTVAPAHGRTVSLSLPLLGYSAWAIASLGWSVDRTASQLAILGGLSWGLLSLLTMAALPVPERRRALARLGQLLIVLGFVASLTRPALAIGHVDAAHFVDFDAAGWRGFFVHKNSFGITMTIAVLLVTGLMGRSWTRWAFQVLGVTLVFLSQSATAAGALISGGIVFLVFRVRPRTRQDRTAYTVTLGASAAAFGLLSPWLFGPILRAFGKDETLTGRRQIWSWGFRLAQRHWLVGQGMLPFGTGADPVVDAEMRGALGFTVNHAHNGVLNALLQVGVVGLLLAGAMVLSTTRTAVADATSGARPWVLACVVALVVASISESMYAFPWLIWLPIFTAAIDSPQQPAGSRQPARSNDRYDVS